MIAHKIAQEQIDFKKIKSYEHQLDAVMEIIDPNEVKAKLNEIEELYNRIPNEINKVKMAIIYHETALNLSFISKSEFKGYAKKSFDILTELFNFQDTTTELLPFISSYRASALSLVAAETKKLLLVKESFKLFEEAVNSYSEISYMPEFLRGSVAENLPWFFFTYKKYAHSDFKSIINKYYRNENYANWKIMSFTYLAMAKLYKSKKDRTIALKYIETSIDLDPDYKAGRKKAEELKSKWF